MEQNQLAQKEERLKLLLASGADCVPIVQGLIEKDNLPYQVITEEVLYGKCHDQKLVENVCEICGKGADAIGYKKTEYKLASTFTEGEQYLNKFITVDKETIKMKEDALKIAASPYEVLITGETGTGKELIAKSMISNREGAIKSVNCAGFPRELMEAELFGYVAGAFTDAKRTTEGLVVSAEDGVMFFDEIALLPMDLQAKLLRVIQERTIRKVGGKTEQAVNCKFVFASNRNLKKMVDNELFMKDFYARISTLELNIGNIYKDRLCDVVPITKALPGGDKFLAKYQEELEDGVLDLSLNVRSIQQHVIRYSVLGRLKIDR